MKHYLIKSINCIVSDAEIKENEYVFNADEKNKIRKAHEYVLTTDKKIEYSNNKIEGLKPFELVDEEAEKLADELFPILAVEENFDSKKSYEMYLGIMETRRVNFIAGYKAKAGYTLQEVYEILGHCWKVTREDEHGVRRFTNGKAATNTDIVADYLQEQESRPIEVQMIQDSVFKIKNN